MSDAIASLIPSGTDIAAALGLGDRLVGVSHECDHAIAEGKPVLTSSILDLTMTPGEIDAAVSASVADGHSLYRTDRPLLHELDPALVLSQDVCDVCAVNGEVARGDVPEGAELIMLTAVRLAHLWEDLARVGKAAGVVDAAEREHHAVEDAAAQAPAGRAHGGGMRDPPTRCRVERLRCGFDGSTKPVFGRPRRAPAHGQDDAAVVQHGDAGAHPFRGHEGPGGPGAAALAPELGKVEQLHGCCGAARDAWIPTI